MKNEPAEGEAFVGTPIVLCDYMRTVEARRVCGQGLCDYIPTVETRCTEPKGGNEIFCSRVLRLRPA